VVAGVVGVMLVVCYGWVRDGEIVLWWMLVNYCEVGTEAKWRVLLPQFLGTLKKNHWIDVQTFTTKASVISYAANCGWSKADAKQAFDKIKLPIDELSLLNIMARFAGPVLLKRQYLQRAQKGQVSQKLTYIQKIELKHAEDIQSFKDEVKQERSQWLGLIRVMYGIASKFGMNDPMIEHILNTYDAA
jgi:hypothetical protein